MNLYVSLGFYAFFPDLIFCYCISFLCIIHSSYFISGYSAGNICLHRLVLPFNFI